MTSISVILCTHNPREGFLRRVLDALRAQTLPLAQWELLLIDNASDAPLASRCDLSWHPHARHVREETLGLTPARLRGICESTSDILVFVDDDTVLAADYLEQAMAVAVQWPFVGSWGGGATPEYETSLPDWVGDQVWRLLYVVVKEDVWSNLRDSVETMPAGAGMCIRRAVGKAYVERCLKQQQAAMFDRVGKSLTGYGDLDLSHCALDLGLGTGRCARLHLTHLIPATRVTLDYFLRHAEGDAASYMVFRATRGLPVKKPAPPSLVESLRWFFHRRIHRVPREQYEIQKAHLRGLKRGWEMAQSISQGKT